MFVCSVIALLLPAFLICGATLLGIALVRTKFLELPGSVSHELCLVLSQQHGCHKILGEKG